MMSTLIRVSTNSESHQVSPSLFLSARSALFKRSALCLAPHPPFLLGNHIPFPLAKKPHSTPKPHNSKAYIPLPCEWMSCRTWNRQRQQGQSWDRDTVWSAYRGAVSDGRFYHNGYRHKAFLQYGSVYAWPCAAPGGDKPDRKSNLRTQTYGYQRAIFQLRGGQNLSLISRKGWFRRNVRTSWLMAYSVLATTIL